MRCRINSRHSNSTKYNTFITYNTNTNSIDDYICSCKSGRRTVGCCSHVATVIHYLSNARYAKIKTSKFATGTIFPDNPILESSDSDSTIIDTDTDSDETIIDDTNYERIYPDLSTLAPL